GQLLATVAYVAPELVTDAYADPRSDVYSTGIVLFEMLTGRVPYDGGKAVDIAWRHVDEDVPRPSKYVPDLPNAVDDLVVRATRRTPDARPSDAGAMLADAQVARDMIETDASLRGRTLAAPTVVVDSLSRGTAEASRPSWARLPNRDDSTRVEGTRRQGSTRPVTRRLGAVTGRSPRDVGTAVMTWFTQVMSRPNGRRTFYATLAALALLIAVTGWWFGAGRYTSAPNLLGETQSQAVATAKKLGFKVKIGKGIFEEKIPKGTV